MIYYMINISFVVLCRCCHIFFYKSQIWCWKRWGAERNLRNL